MTLVEAKLPIVGKGEDERQHSEGRTDAIGTVGLGQPEGRSTMEVQDRNNSQTSVKEWWVSGIEQIAQMSPTPLTKCLAYLTNRGMDLSRYEGRMSFLRGSFGKRGARWYTPVTIRGKTRNFLVDGAASISLIRKDVYAQIQDVGDVIRNRTAATQSDGSMLETYGQVMLPYSIGKQDYIAAPFIADIVDFGILGLDFLSLYAASHQYDTGRLFIGQPEPQTIECELRTLQSVGRVRNPVLIPPFQMSHVEVSGITEPCGRQLLIELDQDFLQEHGVMGCSVLVEDTEMCIPVCNLTPHAIKIEEGQVIGTCVTADVVPLKEVFPVASVHEEDTRELPPHLRNLLDESLLSEEEDREAVAEVMKDYADVFVGPGDPLGRTDRVQHTIDTGDASPVRQPYRRVPLAKRDLVEVELNNMRDQGIISPSESPWASPIVLVRKKDETYRFCIDYRALNEITKKNAFPIPRIDESLDYLGGNTWFCTLDLQAGYWQIGMAPPDREKTAFITHKGLFEFNVMAFGLCNAPATFQSMMNAMLNGLIGNSCLVYLDDVIIFGPTVQACLNNLKIVFQRLRGYGLKLKPRKCKMFQREVEYLGRIVSGNGIRADPGKTQAIQDWPLPGTVRELKSFLGFCSYYREFIPNFAGIAAPLLTMAKGRDGNRTLMLTEEAREAFNALKEVFLSPGILGYPVEGGEFILDTDASLHSIGAVLSQVQDGREVPLSFASNTLSAAQMNYCTTKRELLAIVVYTKKFRHYLFGSKFKIRTDHAALKWLLNFKEADGMMGRWLAHLSELGVSNSMILHRKGSQHVNADALSRQKIRKCPREDCSQCTPPPAPVAAIKFQPNWTLDDIRESQSRDPVIKEVVTWVAEAKKPAKKQLAGTNKEVRQLLSYWPQLYVKEDILYRRKRPPGKRNYIEQIVVPLTMRQEILGEYHGTIIAGHYGLRKSLGKLCANYWWPGVKRELQRWIQGCEQCQLTKAGGGHGRMPLDQEATGIRFARVALDILTGLQPTSQGNVCIMVIQDYYTKYVRCYPLPDHTAPTCAEALVKWILIFGMPLTLHTDQGREFESDLWQKLCETLNIRKTRTNAYRPQSDGLVERFNRTLIASLTTLVNDRQDNWDDLVDYVTFAYNGTPHASTQCSPNLLVFGEEVVTPPELVRGSSLDRIIPPCPVLFVEQIKNNLRDAYTLVREATGKAAMYQKRSYDVRLKTRNYQIGDRAVKFDIPSAKQKLSCNWVGPYTIVGKVADHTVVIRDPRGKESRCHVDRLKPWVDPFERDQKEWPTPRRSSRLQDKPTIDYRE